MSVVTRHRSGGNKTYYVKVTWNEREVWERIGPNYREARSRNAEILREIRAGVFQPKTKRDLTVGEWAEEVARLRHDRSNDGDQKILARHVLSRPWIAGARLNGGLKTPDIRRLLDELRATVSEETGAPLSPKYVANIYGMFRGLFARAMRRGLIDRDPFTGMERREVPRRSRRTRTIYPVEDVRAICTGADVAIPARVLAAVAFLTGQREGEICGGRWADVDWAAAPLAALTVARQYDGRVLKTESEEGERSRKVPIHPALAPLLRWWWERGWGLVRGRAPTLEDPIVPAKDGTHHTRSSAYKMWRRACDAAGVTNRSLHSTRHTMITMARRGGAREDVLERITHNARGTIVDQYTHLDWEPLCQAVLAIDLGPRDPAPAGGGLPSVAPSSLLLPVTEVTFLVTPKQSAAKRPVEAPGIEPRAHDVTNGNDSRQPMAPEQAKRLENKQMVRGADAQWDARHQQAALPVIMRALAAIHGGRPALTVGP